MKPSLQYIIPQLLLSRLMGKLADAKLGDLTHFGIKKFVDHYGVNLDEAIISDYKQFQTFNDFFTRALKPTARKLTLNSNHILSPVDGCVSEAGFINNDQLFQAKGFYFDLKSLCADADIAQHFENGSFLTAYLSPKDYHRFHMPVSGTLEKMIYVPGKLFSVNNESVNHIPNLFSRNERVVLLFDTPIGKMAMIAVGAMIVGSVSMNWHGIVAPQEKRTLQKWGYSQSIAFNQGDEVGHFRLGSTIILLFEKNKINWNGNVRANGVLRLWDDLGTAEQKST